MIDMTDLRRTGWAVFDPPLAVAIVGEFLNGPRCEYHNLPLPLEPNGFGGSCPACDVAAADHAEHCSDCRDNPNLPERGGLMLELLRSVT